MNSLRPYINYTELLAARRYLDIIKSDIEKELNITPKEKKKEIEYINSLKIKTDDVFLKQAAQIEFQIDINYPLT